jgi:hypothetical protein
MPIKKEILSVYGILQRGILYDQPPMEVLKRLLKVIRPDMLAFVSNRRYKAPIYDMNRAQRIAAKMEAHHGA